MSAQCTAVAPSPAARPCRVPGLPAALVEVMLSDLPPSPAAAATPGRFGIRLRRVEDVWRPEASIGLQPYQRRAPRPIQAGEQRFARCCAGVAAVRAEVRFALRAHICRLATGFPSQTAYVRRRTRTPRCEDLERGRWTAQGEL